MKTLGRISLWLLFIAIEIPLWLLGWPVCLLLAATKHYYGRSSTRWPDRVMLQWKGRLAYIYSNEEDGIDGLRSMLSDPYGYIYQQFWIDKTKDWSDFRRIIVWSCWRNPIGNLRFVRPFGFLIDPAKVRWRGNMRDPYAPRDKRRFLWHFVTHGLYSGMWGAYLGYQVRVGWKIFPTDQEGLAGDDYRRKGCGFALQFSRS